jgi:hypothetical protein
MKKLTIAILLLLLASPCLAQEGFGVDNFGKHTPLNLARMNVGIAGGGVTAAGGGACACPDTDCCFGNLDISSVGYNALANYTLGTSDTYNPLICPGTGSKTATKIEAYAKKGSGTAGNIRLAIYNTDNTLVCQGTDEVSVTSTSPSWIGHSGLSCNLTGGTHYRIYHSVDSAEVLYGWTADAAAKVGYTSGDKTGGFTTPFVMEAATNYFIAVRVEVE